MDQVSFATRLDGIATLTVSADAEIMQNYQAALPVAANHRLAAVEDSSGNPMVFSLGSDNHLYLIMADPGGATGWKQLDLTPSLGAFGSPTAFAVGQVKGGNITLVVAATPSGGTPIILIAGPLSNDASQTDWSQLATYWISAGNPQPAATLEALYVGPVDVTTNHYGIPLVAIGYTGGTPGAPNDYLLQPNVTDTGVSWDAVTFPTPTDASVIHDYAMGVIGDMGMGLYILYDNSDGDGQLVFKTLIDPKYGRDYVRELTAPAGATCLESAAGNSATTDLYVGGSGGVTYFGPDQQTINGVGVSIAGADAVPDIREGGLIVRQDQVTDGTVAIWALSGEDLMYFHSSASEPGGYSKPVLFEAGVAVVAPIRSQSKKANQLVFVKTDVLSNPNIVWMWQDTQSSLWQRDSIPLQSTGATLEYTCYTTTLTFLDDRGQARPGLTVQVAASGWTRTLINGVCHLLDQGSAVTATTDLTGNLTLINPVADLATPRFIVTAPESAWFDGALVIEPAAKVYQRLKQVQSGADIPDYVLAKLPAGISKDQVAEAITHLMAFPPDPAPQGTVIAWYASAPAMSMAVVPKSKSAPDQTLWSLGFARKTTSFSVVGEIWDGVTNLAGDLWQFATSVIDKVTHIAIQVVDKALTFVVELVDKTIQIVIQTLEDVFKAITFILKAVAAVIQDIIKWLGFLFNWQDIWDAHQVLANFVTSGLTYVEGRLDAEVEVWKAGIVAICDRVKSAIHGLVLPDEVGNAELQSAQQAAAQSNPQASTNQTTTNWTLYQVQHGGVTDGTSSSGTPSPGNPLVQFIQDVVMPTLQGIQADIEQMLKDVGALFESKPTVNDFLRILTDFIDVFIDAVQNIMVGLLDFAEDLLADIKALVTAPLEIPFFSGLYRFVTKLLGTEEELTLVNVLSLVAAIPTTILYKLATNEEPFPDGIDALMQPDIFQQMLGTPARKTLVLAETDVGEVEHTNFSYTYSHFGGFAAGLIEVVANLVGLVNVGFKARRGGVIKTSPESQPLSGTDPTQAYQGKIDFLDKVELGLGVLTLLCSFPVPKHEDQTSDVLAGLEWGAGWVTMVGGLLLDKYPGGKVGTGLGLALDVVVSLVQYGLLTAGNVLDNQAESSETGVTTEEVLKYIQDACTCFGAVARDIGEGALEAPSAVVKAGGAIGAALGIALSMGASVCLWVRVVISADSDDEVVVRTQI